ncbi:MAG: phosphodiesterase [Firmicutes bacterium]|nr:phosphodiesterase [Bacillota bacterium]
MICSDLHGDLTAAETIVQIFHKEKADQLIILGDLLFCGYRIVTPTSYQPEGVAALLNPMADKIISVAGNCDRLEDRQKLHFEMPRHRHFRLGKHIVFLAHGDENLDFPLAKGDILLFGHTHRPLLKEEDGIVYANPGSAALPRGGSAPSYLVLSERGLFLKEMNGSVVNSVVFKE